MYGNTKSLCCVIGTNTVLKVNYTSKKEQIHGKREQICGCQGGGGVGEGWIGSLGLADANYYA